MTQEQLPESIVVAIELRREQLAYLEKFEVSFSTCPDDGNVCPGRDFEEIMDAECELICMAPTTTSRLLAGILDAVANEVWLTLVPYEREPTTIARYTKQIAELTAERDALRAQLAAASTGTP